MTSAYKVIRFIPVLSISQADLAKGCAVFAEAVEAVVEHWKWVCGLAAGVSIFSV